MNPLHVKREKGVDTKSIEFVMSDSSGDRRKCALWSQHASKLFDFVSEYRHPDVPIDVLHHNCKVRDWQGFAQVSNQLWGCCIYINEDVAPIRTFKSEYVKQLKMLTVLNLWFTTCDVIAESSTKGQTKVPELEIETILQTAVDIFSKHQPKTMEELLQITEVTSCVIRGRVQKINVNEGWLLILVLSATRKLHLGCVLIPIRLLMIVKSVELLKIVRTTIRAVDATGECTLVLFDSQLSKMLKKSVSWLREKADQVF
ncbi:uncharacterized protein [Rutidosis leptorrhynchoides]|uniref:uncharacterized protein n=1 Tax=Rutidosis leptorrhynchoides TaxID=125765 RepID=UPI003A997F56